MVVGVHRPTKLILDGQALAHNIAVSKAPFDENIDVFAVVKANAYGHGVAEIAKMAKAAGATGFAVALLDEGIELRELGYTDEPILVLGITPSEWAVDAAKYRISLTVGDLDWLQVAQPLLARAGINTPLRVHMGVDTGMGRIGVRTPADLVTASQYLRNHATEFEFEGMFTHFATADEENKDYFESQLGNWQAAINAVKPLPRFVHAANSAASLWRSKEVPTNVLRLGAAMYGFNPSGDVLPESRLQPVMSLTTEIAFVKQVAAGDKVSYGATYTATDEEWIATLPIGYADGFLRRMQGFHVLVNGEYADIVGRVTMDQTMIRLSAYQPVGTTVTIVGQDGDKSLTLSELANYAATIPYEIVTDFSTRIKREVK
ncbi:alanine racemase [Periweissella cryptocerci]|uniref:Alanine racemase n=1 Tax=Periweissella cryptocerci TaxID=2506420 RepID=A0A4P6YUN0_9LACO|nr:alanine racemase [Periweissella cryptocerci]QBO36499.1 alanine racemase [Periweissella cryptocerci]